mmetsp:Transcript_217/g.588  ORF Transcript_217/g.588 Transcript_217/m.588 type:complete len:291 (-) Transcript_217:250-1122(-)
MQRPTSRLGCHCTCVTHAAISHGPHLRRLRILDPRNIERLFLQRLIVVMHRVEPHGDGMTPADRVARRLEVRREGARFLQLDLVHASMVHLADVLVDLARCDGSRRLVRKSLAPMAKVGRYDAQHVASLHDGREALTVGGFLRRREVAAHDGQHRDIILLAVGDAFGDVRILHLSRMFLLINRLRHVREVQLVLHEQLPYFIAQRVIDTQIAHGRFDRRGPRNGATVQVDMMRWMQHEEMPHGTVRSFQFLGQRMVRVRGGRTRVGISGMRTDDASHACRCRGIHVVQGG